ncbi:hypothetical protein HUO13_28375 [Saccharopolyspora erythraea]|uniref:hypothetical protein n=1 Tax=Saccharopolyspora erythraea TaxID=1836 RepID=UPI001BAB544A|nr:hypothetical protein [Saccharopolyspora erythraea]QUH04189.1 hypothetical protein HUO13_28375 [Saccharopolyspora erythraea]
MSDDAGTAGQARAAAWKAWRSARRWTRTDGEASPVENCLPASYRVGYEGYTADAHYSSLSLAFWALALESGLEDRPVDPADHPTAWYEHFPTYRAVAHCGSVSAHVNADPARKYDVFGLADITFGLDRHLHFATPTEHIQSGKIFTVGLGLRGEPGRAPVRVVAHDDFSLRELDSNPDRGELHLAARAKGASYGMGQHERDVYVSSSMPGLTDDTYEYRCRIQLAHDEVTVLEATPHLEGYKTLLVPYLLDGGRGCTTSVSHQGNRIVFEHGPERIELVLDSDFDPILVLDHGFESRRGFAGLVRIDLTEPTAEVRYRLVVVQ